MRLLRMWLGYAIMLAGLAVLAWPFVSGAVGQAKQQSVTEDFYRQTEAALAADRQTGQDTDIEPDTAEPAETSEPDPVETEPAETSAPEPTAVSVPYTDAFYADAAAYNDRILAERQSGLVTIEATENFPLDARDYGYDENIVGTIYIPRMDVELGLYLGADTTNMAKGAAVFGQTSLPLGRESENCSIAGHRGWRGTDMFRNIQLLREGDPIYITTPWAVLVYRVCEIDIVTPEDTWWCEIQTGRTLISLMTCHPYTQHYQRYIVFAELAETYAPDVSARELYAAGAGAETESEQESAEEAETAQVTALLHNEDGTVETVSVDAQTIQPDGTEYGAVWSNIIILTENSMRLVLYILGGVIAVTGVWLTVYTVRESKRNRREDHETAG